jgi:hypothetical protein
MSKLTLADMIPGELYVFTDTDPVFSSWVGLVARAICRHGRSGAVYLFEPIELTDELRKLGYSTEELLNIKVKRFERYPVIPSASDPLFS